MTTSLPELPPTTMIDLMTILATLDDPMDALQFCSDASFPMSFAARELATTIRSIHKIYSDGHFSDSTVNDLLSLLTCDFSDCDEKATITFQLDTDPADAETGPQPDIWTLRACTEDHRDALTEYMT